MRTSPTRRLSWTSERLNAGQLDCMRLLLFDIDGTLLSADGQGRKAIERGMTDFLGFSAPVSGLKLAGRTDREIIRGLLAESGRTFADTEASISAALLEYERVALASLDKRSIQVLKGIPSLLERLRVRSDVQLGLVTGNIESVAWHKLAGAGIDGYFALGAFGSDHEDRSALVALAIERARVQWGRAFEGRSVVVIGDTVRDVAGARSNGAVAVAVATGPESEEELAASGPDMLFRDLSDLAAFESLVLMGSATA